MIGTTISHYKITGKLGEGGMGVVYKAEDTSLERPVALKFLAPHLVSDEEVRKRFEREAKAAAALNHPNVCTVHEIAEANGRTFIAMAFIEGDSLEAKIEAGPLKLKDALDIAIQTAQGLQAAHEKKIVHRDIKPANLMVTGEGAKQLVTIMDFGLALLTDRSKLTKHEETMGTVTYMSPEQAQGMDLDHRTDIWSLGAVIYEMVTGQQAFKGHYDQATVYSILNEDPEPITALRTGVPMELEWIVGKCLAKDIENRYQNASDMVVDLRNLRDKLKSGRSAIVRTAPAGSVGARHAVPAAGDETTGTRAQHAVPLHSPGEASEHRLAKYRVIEEVAESDTSTKYLAEDTELHRSVAIRVLPQASEQQIERAQRRKQSLLLGTTALGVLLALVFAFFPLFSPAPEAPLRRFTLPTEEGLTRPSISPNGRHVAYLTGPGGNRTLWVQDLDQNQPRAIVGPSNIQRSMPFWSPDSQFVGFRSRDGGVLRFKRVAASGGPVVTLAESSGFSRRSAWTPDGESVIFRSERKLFTVPARGGPAELWLEAEQEGFAASQPAFFSTSQGTDKLLYVEARTEAQVIALDRTSGQREILAEGRFPVYAPSGHVVYESIEPRGVWAIPFSVDTMKATGNPFPINEDSYEPSIALDGTLVYLQGTAATGRWRLVWKDREGSRLGEIGEPHDVSISYPGLSPDGSRVVVQENATGNSGWDIWVHEMNRPIKTRLTDLPSNEIYPSWSPQGDRIIFSSGGAGPYHRDLYTVLADGSEDPVLFLESPEFRSYVTDWSSDGNTILVWRQYLSGAKADLWYLKRKEGGGWEESPFLQTEYVEQLAKLSPDVRFIAYDSDRSGEREVYVRSFPDGTGVRRVSTNGGTQVRWRKDGKELFYVEGDALMAVSVSTSPKLTIGAPEKLFSDDTLVFRPRIDWLNYDVTPDGQRFVVREREQEAGEAAVKLRVVQNWYEEFRDREQD